MKDLRLYTTIVTVAKLRKYTTRVTLDILETYSLKTKPKRCSTRPAPVNAVHVSNNQTMWYVCDPQECQAAWRYLFKPSHSHSFKATMTSWFTGKLHIAQAALYSMIKCCPINVYHSTWINVQVLWTTFAISQRTLLTCSRGSREHASNISLRCKQQEIYDFASKTAKNCFLFLWSAHRPPLPFVLSCVARLWWWRMEESTHFVWQQCLYITDSKSFCSGKFVRQQSSSIWNNLRKVWQSSFNVVPAQVLYYSEVKQNNLG